MSDDEPLYALVRCLRVEELDSPVPGSEVRSCAVCGRRVWFDTALTEEIAVQCPGHEIVIQCRQCLAPGDEDSEVTFVPGQVRRLRAQGASDEEIAYLFALADLTGLAGDMDATMRRLLSDPTGEEAARFTVLLENARVRVALS